MSLMSQYADQISELKFDLREARATIESLTSALQQAADVIEHPATAHDSEVNHPEITGLPRYSAGARLLNKKCYDLRIVLRKALEGK